MSKEQLHQYIVDTYPPTIPPTTPEHEKVIGAQLTCMGKIARDEITTTAEIDAEFS